MLDIQIIRDAPERVRQAIMDKGAGDVETVDRILKADMAWREATTRTQELQAASNTAAKQIGELMKLGRRDEAQTIITQTAEQKQEIQVLQTELRQHEDLLAELLLEVPNIPHESVPVGKTPDDNVTAFEWGSKPTFDFPALPHWELIDALSLVDFERGSKVSGAGFPFYRGAGARLQRALILFFLDTAVSEGGYTEIQPPLVVNEDSARGTGQLPDKEDLMYEVKRDGLFLIPTAEVPVTNLHRDEIIDEKDLPITYCAYTPCFRREAGSHGKDVRGLNRLHQFDKVELVRFVVPETSYDELEILRSDAERLLQKLGLPYRRLLMCTGDMGFTQTKKYDLEVWSAGQERWLEVSSISNFESFQARRMKIRYRPGNGGKPQILHTLNGSALAIPRIVAALLENGQQADGSIKLPDVLVPWMGTDRISPPSPAD